MKKIVAIFTLLVAVSFSAKAQEKKLPPQEEGKAQAAEMISFLKLDDKQAADYTKFLSMKTRTMADPSLSAEKKKKLSDVVVKRLEGTLTKAQMAQLRGNTALYERIIN